MIARFVERVLRDGRVRGRHFWSEMPLRNVRGSYVGALAMATIPPVWTSSTTRAPAFALVNPILWALAIASASAFSVTSWTSLSIVSSTSLARHAVAWARR